MTDGTLPFRNYSDKYKEKDKKQMKESELFDENKVSLVKTVRKIQGKGQKFDVSGVLYATKLNKYVFPRKYDAEKKIYTCRQKNAQEDCEIAESELSQHINVKIRI